MVKINQNILSQFRISPLEREIYLCLVNHPKQSVVDLSGAVRRSVESINRSVNSLCHKGFVEITGKYPKIINAIPLEQVFPNTKLTKGDNQADLTQPFFQIINKRSEYFEESMKKIRNAASSICIYSSGSGEFVPEYFRLMCEKIKQGINYRVIIQSLNENNQVKIENWLKNKIQVRVFAGKGVNFIIIDQRFIQIGFRVKDESKEKVGIMIENQTLAGLFSDLFENMWDQAQQL